jgi:hypothetical protein
MPVVREPVVVTAQISMEMVTGSLAFSPGET